jgi:hypothetical protein
MSSCRTTALLTSGGGFEEIFSCNSDGVNVSRQYTRILYWFEVVRTNDKDISGVTVIWEVRMEEK